MKIKLDYKKAEKSTPPGVRMEIKKWRKLPLNIRLKKPLWSHLLGGSTQPGKFPKSVVQYIGQSLIPAQRCGNCTYFYENSPNGRAVCSIVKGNIEAQAWCNRWEKGLKKSFQYDIGTQNAMVMRADPIGWTRDMANTIVEDVETAAREEGLIVNTPEGIYLGIADREILPADKVAVYHEPGKGPKKEFRTWGQIHINPQAFTNLEFVLSILKHELIHAVLGDQHTPGTHPPEFLKLADRVGLAQEYQN